ncbi:MAG TPA: sigma-70 family RNA polymerase sigma factor [Patescibacteria group bacterium]|nr:sigma-70 family RNA polymerase sigma factor [Patescibacteria group bacterium]
MSSHVETDEDIAKKVQAGDLEAFGYLVERYEQKLLRYARKFLLLGEDGQDLVQDVFIKAYTNIHSFDPELKFSPWIYRIAHNTFINALEKRKRQPLSLFEFEGLLNILPARSDPEKDINRDMDKSMVEAGLKELDEKYREPLVLFYLEEFDYSEIADILHMPVSTVGVRIKRGRDQLKKVLAKKQ